jgi:hypothetical protein
MKIDTDVAIGIALYLSSSWAMSRLDLVRSRSHALWCPLALVPWLPFGRYDGAYTEQPDCR